MNSFADTGFLISLYISETTSASAAAVVSSQSESLPVTSLTELEFRTALRLNVFRGKTTETERAAAWQAFEEDVVNGVLTRVEVDSQATFSEATNLCDRFVATHGARTLDVFQVASALVLHCSTFLSFDRRQRAIASAAGLKLLPENV